MMKIVKYFLCCVIVVSVLIFIGVYVAFWKDAFFSVVSEFGN